MTVVHRPSSTALPMLLLLAVYAALALADAATRAVALDTLTAAALGGAPAMVVALWLSEFAPRASVEPLRRVFEALAAVPLIAWGHLGVVALAPAQGAPGIAPIAAMLAVMIAPTFTLLAFRALRRTPDAMREASLALGASRWQTALRAVLPWARGALLGAMVRAVGRACAEGAVLLWLTAGFSPREGASPLARALWRREAYASLGAIDGTTTAALVAIAVAATLVGGRIAREHEALA